MTLNAKISYLFPRLRVRLIIGKIAFISDRDGNQEIYVMDSRGGNQRRLTNTPDNEWDPAWSPDGTKIAFVSERNDYGDIYNG